ncbi:MAG TPA: AI-2E family transporter [Gemmatimonadales bacterium]|nr:AI-2E family transporter [Gemmatimonadales bacterium]
MVTRSTDDAAQSAALRPDVSAPGEATSDAPSAEGGAVEQPDLRKLGDALRERVEVRSLAITGLFILAVLYTLYFARAFLLPIVLAVLLDFLLSPVIRMLKRVRVPEPLGAALVILALLGVLGGAVYSLADPAKEWMRKAPQSIATVQGRLRELRRPVDQVTKTAEQVEAAAEGTKSGPQEVIVRGPRLSERIFGTTQSLLTGTLETLILLYFLLAAGDLFLQKLIKVLPLLRDKKKAVAIARETEASISTYLLTVAVVNVGLGIAVTLVMLLLKMPNAMLWGVLAAVAEFVPYIGATVMLGLLTMAGLVAFPDLGHAFLVPAAYMGVNLIQANFVSPTVLGRRLTLNPVAILVGLVFWWWIWGVGGAFIAVPLLATFKIFCDHIESLAPIGEFLGK